MTRLFSILFFGALTLSSGTHARLKIVALGNFMVGLADDDEVATLRFKVAWNHRHLLNWILASEASLEDSVVFHEGDNPSVGGYGTAGQYYVNANYIKRSKSADGNAVEYYFIKDGLRLKLYSHAVSVANPRFAQVYDVLATSGGFIRFNPFCVNIEDEQTPFPNDWLVRDTGLIGPSAVPFSILKIVDPHLRRHTVDLQLIRACDWSKANQRVVVVQGAHPPFVVGPSVVLALEALEHYSNDRVWSLLRRNIPCAGKAEEKLILTQNGNVVLFPISGADYLTLIATALQNALANATGAESFVLPVYIGNSWIALVIDRNSINFPLLILESQPIQESIARGILQVVIKSFGFAWADAQIQYSTFFRDTQNDFGGLTVERILAFLKIPRNLGNPKRQDIYDRHLQELSSVDEVRPTTVRHSNDNSNNNNNNLNNTDLGSRQQHTMSLGGPNGMSAGFLQL